MTDLAVARNDYEAIESLIRQQDLEKLPESALLRFADTTFRLKRPDLAQIMLTKLSKDYLRESPALAAILQVCANDTPQTMAALANIPRDMSAEAKDCSFNALHAAQHAAARLCAAGQTSRRRC